MLTNIQTQIYNSKKLDSKKPFRKMRFSKINHKNESQNYSQKQNSQKWLTKMIHKHETHKNDSQKWDMTQKMRCDLKNYSQKWVSLKLESQIEIHKNDT